jgi:hypothetical protein
VYQLLEPEPDLPRRLLHQLSDHAVMRRSQRRLGSIPTQGTDGGDDA